VLDVLRRQTAWIDPAVQIWNRTLIENLRYGMPPDAAMPWFTALDAADLLPLLQSLPAGLQTQLGEGGALVSGGEGQRVRLGRGLMRAPVRLVVLDEAFRGLDRAQRRCLLQRARQWWHEATLICITHDLVETQFFDRVVVLEAGHITDDDAPGVLAERASSAYRALLEAEQTLYAQISREAGWQFLRLQDGRLVEHEGGEAS
jgi:ABC-type transport system involved in cytochrome bd biosynthesis fused ATPase/permease subunit